MESLRSRHLAAMKEKESCFLYAHNSSQTLCPAALQEEAAPRLMMSIYKSISWLTAELNKKKKKQREGGNGKYSVCRQHLQTWEEPDGEFNIHYTTETTGSEHLQNSSSCGVLTNQGRKSRQGHEWPRFIWEPSTQTVFSDFFENG